MRPLWSVGARDSHRVLQEPQMTEIGAQMSQNSSKCAVWPFGTHRDRQEPQMTEIGANEPKLIQMCSLAIWHTSRPSGTSDDRNWRTNEPNSSKCAVWPFGTQLDPQEPQMTEIGAQFCGCDMDLERENGTVIGY